MELTPEEKNRIYEEEKAKIEALERIKGEITEQKEAKKQKIAEGVKREKQICLKIIGIIAVTWFLYYPIKEVSSLIFLSKEVMEEVHEVDDFNRSNKDEIERDKQALWDVGLKDASLKIRTRLLTL